jgi:hypothetical protein
MPRKRRPHLRQRAIGGAAEVSAGDRVSIVSLEKLSRRRVPHAAPGADPVVRCQRGARRPGGPTLIAGTSGRVVPRESLHNRTVLASATKMRKRVPAGMTPCGCGTPANPSATPTGHAGPILSVAFSPDGHPRLAPATRPRYGCGWRILRRTCATAHREHGPATTGDWVSADIRYEPVCSDLPTHGEIRCCPRRSAVPSPQQWSGTDPGDEEHGSNAETTQFRCG